MTMVHLLVAAALTASLGGGVVLLMSPADAVVRAEQDAIDVQQRLRVVVDALTASIGAAADVVPVANGMTLVTRDADGVELGRRTYEFRPGTHQVMVVEGASTMPLVDRISDLRFAVVDATARRVRVTVAVESPSTSGRPQPARTVTFEVAPRRGA